MDPSTTKTRALRTINTRIIELKVIDDVKQIPSNQRKALLHAAAIILLRQGYILSDQGNNRIVLEKAVKIDHSDADSPPENTATQIFTQIDESAAGVLESAGYTVGYSFMNAKNSLNVKSLMRTRKVLIIKGFKSPNAATPS